MVVADHVLGELSYRRRPPESWSLTTELTLDLVGDLAPGQRVVASASEVAAGAGASFAQGRLVDESGRVFALGSTRTVVVGSAQSVRAADIPVAVERRDCATAEAALGVVYGTVAGSHIATLTAPGEWVNTFGILHGGVASCVAELAAERLFGERNPQLTTARIHTNYLGPVRPGRPYSATARAYRVGRGFAVAEVLGRSGDELCTVSMITARGSQALTQERQERA